MLTVPRPMTVPAQVGLLDVLGTCLTELAARLNAHLLVESATGAVVAHASAAAPAPDAFAHAVLRRSPAGLTGALIGRRSVAVLPGGPMMKATLPGWDGQVICAPLTAAGQRIGWLWLLAPAGALPVPSVTEAIAEVTVAASCPGTVSLDEPVSRALAGEAPLPISAAVGAVQAWVVVLGDPQQLATAEQLRAAVVRSWGRPAVRMAPACLDGAAYLVLLSDTELSPAEVCRLIDARLEAAEPVLGGPLVAAVSAPTVATVALDVARNQADAALAAKPVAGRCTSLAEARADVVLDRCAAAAESLPDLGHDPVRALLAHDARKGTQLAVTLLAWLDENGDVTAAAERLKIHANTLRYRLRRLPAVTGVDVVADPTVRLEMYLRLRAAAKAHRWSR